MAGKQPAMSKGITAATRAPLTFIIIVCLGIRVASVAQIAELLTTVSTSASASTAATAAGTAATGGPVDDAWRQRVSR